jgi:glycosyltransferase involved in cell wall biosynthesis
MSNNRSAPRGTVTLSIVSPAHDEEANLVDLYEALEATLCPSLDWELILVNDGSTDGTARVMRELCERSPRVKAILLSRCYGHQIALTAGVDAAVGDAVVTMDSDLEHPPQLIPAMVAKWREGHEVVLGRRRTRSWSLSRRVSYWLFFQLMRRVAGLDLVANTADFVLMDRQVVGYFRQYRESSRFVRGIVCDLGYRRAIVDYDEPKRRRGRSNWNFWRLLKFGLNGVIAFSAFPLRLSLVLGMIFSFASLSYAALIVLYKVLYGAPAGLPSILVGIFFLGGIQLISIGMLGEYVAQVFTEVKRRPLYCISEVIGAERTDA